MTKRSREHFFASAEGLLNHVENHFMLHNQKLRISLIDDIARHLERIYQDGRKDELEETHDAMMAMSDSLGVMANE